MSRIIKATSAGGAHPDVGTHDAMGLSTDAELTAHAAVSAASTHGSLGHSNASDHANTLDHSNADDHVNSEAAHAWHVAHIDSLTAAEHTAIGDGTPHHAAAHGDHGVATHIADATDPHAAANYVKEADANWIDLTDAGATTLHSHAGGAGANVGTAVLDFGAFPGASDASVDVIGQAGIAAGSVVMTHIRPVDSADHSADEHLLETIKVLAGNIVAGTGFTVYGLNTSQFHEPVGMEAERAQFVAVAASVPGAVRTQGRRSVGGKGTRIYGQWNVAWQWA